MASEHGQKTKCTILMGTFFLFFTCLLVAANPSTALATSLDDLTLENAKGTVKVTTSLGQNYSGEFTPDYYQILSKPYKYENPTEASSSKESVVSTETWDDCGFLGLTFKKAGTATVSYKWKGTTHTVKFKVYAYANPLKSFKVGSKQFVSKFKKSAVGYYGPYYGGKVVVSSAKNWTIKKILTLGEAGTKTIKNKTKIKKGKVDFVIVTLKNKKTQVVQKVSLNLGANYGG